MCRTDVVGAEDKTEHNLYKVDNDEQNTDQCPKNHNLNNQCESKETNELVDGSEGHNRRNK
jgi:hypothetical protein